jgi:uncharacterized protein
MKEYSKTSRSTIKRIPKRGRYDAAAVHAVLDAGRVCHAGFVIDGQPFVIPTAYGRDGETIYLHGATTSRMLTHLKGGASVSIAVTHLDGVVLARSVFHHSLNYRSAVVFGTARLVTDAEEKAHALSIVSEQMLPGRWAEARGPNAKEDKATSVVAVSIEEASAKIRTGGPVDDEPDYSLSVWAGVLPIRQTYGPPQPDERLLPGVALAASVAAALSQGEISVPTPTLPPIARPETDEYAPYYGTYIGKVPGDAAEALAAAFATTPALLAAIPAVRWDYAYAPGKWTIKELLLHVLDTERIMAYRALRISRGDQTPLPGFDQDPYVPNSGAADRSPESLIAEYCAVRQATLHLLAGLPPATLTNRGTASTFEVSVRALVYIIAGHERHHLAILRERYLLNG